MTRTLLIHTSFSLDSNVFGTDSSARSIIGTTLKTKLRMFFVSGRGFGTFTVFCLLSSLSLNADFDGNYYMIKLSTHNKGQIYGSVKLLVLFKRLQLKLMP